MGRLAPGTRLKLADLTERFGVSQIPVREALHQLEQESLVELIPHLGARVAPIIPGDSVEIAELRLLLEPYAAERATGRMTEASFVTLREAIVSMDTAIVEEDYESYLHNNNLFHDTIYAHSGNQMLFDILNQLRDAALRHFYVYRNKGHMDQGHADHLEILQALEHADADMAHELTYRHRKRILDKLISAAR